MAFGVIHTFPGGTKSQYEASVKAVHPADGSLPAGQIYHAAGASPGGWTIVARIDKVSLDIAVVLGTAWMPVHQVLRLGRGARHDLGEDLGGLVSAQVAARGERIDGARDDVVGHQSPRKFASSVRPESVSTDSG